MQYASCYYLVKAEDPVLNTQAPYNEVLQQLNDDIEQCLYADRPRQRRQWHEIKKRLASDKPVDRSIDRLKQSIAASLQQKALRSNTHCQINFPEELPVSQKRDDIAAAIATEQVVILAGETGSGKTTQLPKICLQLGRGILGRIGHTQPRRIAARSVAQRIADEMQSELGGLVGYQVRFHDQVQVQSRIKLMTDGILLAEIHRDRDLLQYDTLIIDEAHERSLNIDFLLGYLPALLLRRPELKLIITSATIATEKFSRHFSQAPVIEVSGRSYPVEVLYRPLHVEDPDTEDLQLQEAVLAAVDELARIDRGDVLIFLSSEREIRDMAEALRKHHPSGTEILPLFSRLSASEQNKVFQSHSRRRIVLATNVAETSLTVPGIRYVIDPGLARMSRYSYRSKVQRLPIEKISQASANQRKGRCGRVSAGVCIRLYDEEDFLQRPEFTEPEIQRTNLASVILNMKTLGLGDIEAFPFMDPPDRRFINDGYRLLFELGAVDSQRRLTTMGKEMARLSIDPRLARMILQAKTEDCLKEILVIVCALEIQDPRERPLDMQQKADEAHKVFIDEASDFRTLLNLWASYQQQKKTLSNNKLRKWCSQSFISSRRLQEWRDLHLQISHQVKEMGMPVKPEDAEDEAIMRALLSGLVSHIGFNMEDKEYQGSHGKKFMIFPGSALFKKKPKWIMAAEIVETARLYARTVAVIKPEWVEQVAPQLIKYSYSEPVWQARAGQVSASEKLTVYGLILISHRKVNYGRIDPVMSRQIFIRSALVQGDFRTREKFYQHNMQLMQQVQLMEEKTRRRDIMQDEQSLYEFYDQRIPTHVYSQPAFEKWWRQQKKNRPDMLNISIEDLIQPGCNNIQVDAWPDHLSVQGFAVPLSYHFAPGDQDDGVTAMLPLMILNQLQPDQFDWLVPGMLQDKLVQLIKSLPKSLRRNFVPAPEFARACISHLSPDQGGLPGQLGAQLHRMSGVEIPLTAWQVERLPDHLRMNFRIIDDEGRVVEQGRDLSVLQARLHDRASASFSARSSLATEQQQPLDTDIECWDFGDLEDCVEIETQGVTLRSYPALVEREGRLSLAPMDQPEQAQQETMRGLVCLFKKVYRKDVEYVRKNIANIKQACLYYAPLGRCDELQDDILYLSIFSALKLEDGIIRSSTAFAQRGEQARKNLMTVTNEVAALVLDVLTQFHQLNKRLSKNIAPLWLKAVADIHSQIEHLFYKGFLHQTAYENLNNYPRYLKALQLRIDKLATHLERDNRQMAEIQACWSRYLQASDAMAMSKKKNAELEKYRWMLEEYRVSLFAQELKTAYPVSAKRLQEQWKKAGSV